MIYMRKRKREKNHFYFTDVKLITEISELPRVIQNLYRS